MVATHAIRNRRRRGCCCIAENFLLLNMPLAWLGVVFSFGLASIHRAGLRGLGAIGLAAAFVLVVLAIQAIISAIIATPIWLVARTRSDDVTWIATFGGTFGGLVAILGFGSLLVLLLFGVAHAIFG